MSEVDGFIEMWEYFLQQTTTWKEEIERYREPFWRWLGKPEPESELYFRRLEVLPFFWALQRTDHGDERNLDRLWHQERDNNLFWLDLIGWRQAEPVLIRITKETEATLHGQPLQGKPQCVKVADWQTGAGGKGRWLAAWTVPWQGALWLVPGYQLLSRENGDALIGYARSHDLPVEASLLTPASYRLAAALPRYPSARLEDILTKTALFSDGEERAQTN